MGFLKIMKILIKFFKVDLYIGGNNLVEGFISLI